MLPRPRGYNHDVRYRGQVFHIQSEVCGGAQRQVRTQLFSRGAVLASERTPVDDDDDAGIESMLREQHKSLLRELCRGTFDAWLPGARTDEPAAPTRPLVPEVRVAVRRRGVALEIRGRDCPERCEVAIEVCHGADIIAVRRAGYGAADDGAQIGSALRAELDGMIAKLRRGGLDARLPTSTPAPSPTPTPNCTSTPSFVFVPPPIPR